VMNAGVASGLLAPSIVRQMRDADPTAVPAWQVAFHYSGIVNQAFATVFVVASSLALLLWSASILRGKALPAGIGIYGMILSVLTMVGVLAGHVRLNVHGFGAIVLGQAIWYVSVAFQLYRESPLAAQADRSHG